MQENMKTASLIIFFFILIISNCDIYNQSVPDYLDENTNSASVGQYKFTKGIITENKASVSLVQPDTEIELKLKNPRRYELIPSLVYYHSSEGWKNFTNRTTPTGEYHTVKYADSTLPGTINVKYESPDVVKIIVSGACVSEIYNLKLSLKDRATSREFGSYEVPKMKCTDYPMVVNDLGLTAGLDEKGINISFKQAVRNNASDANQLVISCAGLSVTETYKRTFDGTAWSKWKTDNPANKEIDFVNDIYSVHIGSSTALTINRSYEIKLAFTNTDGISLNTEETFSTGTGVVKVRINGGEENHYQSLKDGLNSIRDGESAVVTVLSDVSQSPYSIIGTGKTITLTAEGSRTLRLGGAGSLFTVNSGIKLIIGNTVSAGNTLTLKGVGINNKALITVNSGGELELNRSVIITENYNSQNGGGIHSSGTFTMKGGAISSNSASSGGGVFIEGGTFTMESGVIGGSASLEGNTAGEGGGVCVVLGSFIMKGDGKISYNNVTGTISRGGGVLLAISGSLAMSGNAEISNNSSTGNNAKGSGVYIDEGSFSLGGGAKVNIDNDIYLAGNNKITLGSFTSGNSIIGRITPQAYTEDKTVLGGTIGSSYLRFEVTQGGADIWLINNNGAITKAAAMVEDGGTVTYHSALNEAFSYIDGNISAGTETIVTLYKDVTLASYAVTKKITLKTGGENRIIQLSGAGSLFTVSSGAKLTVEGQSGSTLTLKGVGANDKALITVNSSGTLELRDGVIITGNSNSNASSFGGGVYVNVGGIFTMKSGTIEGNSSVKGSGVYINNTGIFNMSGDARVNVNNDIYLPANLLININNIFTGTDTVGIITPESYLEVKVLTGESEIVGSSCSRFKVTDDPDENYYWVIDYTGYLKKLPVFKMIQVPAGTFTLRSGGPEMTISKNYWMAETEVTQGLWQAVMGSNPSSFASSPTAGETQAKRPVENITWYDALVFCNKLSILDGKTPVYSIGGSTNPDNWGAQGASWDSVTANWAANGYRLPTEMEWMWAAMGARDNTTGYSKPFAGSNGSNNINAYAWYNSNASSKTHEVGIKLPNELGLYDMSGNVYEWCWDWAGTHPGTAQTDYRGLVIGSRRVIRSGSWNGTAASCTVAQRSLSTPLGKNNRFGFRFIRTE